LLATSILQSTPADLIAGGSDFSTWARAFMDPPRLEQRF